MRPIGDANSFARLRLDLLSQIAEARAAGDDDLAALEDALRDIEQRLAKLESRPPVIVAGGGMGERRARAAGSRWDRKGHRARVAPELVADSATCRTDGSDDY